MRATSDPGERVIDGKISTTRVRGESAVLDRLDEKTTPCAGHIHTTHLSSGPNVVWTVNQLLREKGLGIDLLPKAEYKHGNNKAPRTSGPKKFMQKLTPIGYG